VQRPIAAFGVPRPMTSDALKHFLTPEAAAIGPVEEDGSAFVLLLATQQNFLLKLDREQLSCLHAVIEQTLRNAVSEAGH
jgi:hypothetical protein